MGRSSLLGRPGQGATDASRMERAQAARIAELDQLIDDLTAQIAAGQAKLRREATGVAALPSAATASRHRNDRATGALAAADQGIAALRARRREAINERDQLQHTAIQTLNPGPHAHLRHRAVPDTATPANVLLRFWTGTGASLTTLLALLRLTLLLDLGPLWRVMAGAVLAVTAIEAALRRRLVLYCSAYPAPPP